jgi:hypothetical protein
MNNDQIVLLSQLFEECKQSKHLLCQLKNLAVKAQNYELALELRVLETQLFPNTLENQRELLMAQDVVKIFGMFGYNVSPKCAWKMNEAFKKYHQNGAVSDVEYVDIQKSANELFVD